MMLSDVFIISIVIAHVPVFLQNLIWYNFTSRPNLALFSVVSGGFDIFINRLSMENWITYLEWKKREGKIKFN